jgi:hypothetical protein
VPWEWIYRSGTDKRPVIPNGFGFLRLPT